MEAAGSEKASKITKSSRSSASNAAIRARAQAEAAKARASYAEKEAKLKVESAAKEAELHLSKAKLEAELKALEFKREAAAAIAQAEALEAAEELESEESDSVARQKLQKDIELRTKEYVGKQAQLQSQQSYIPAAAQSTGPSLDASFITWHALPPQDVQMQEHAPPTNHNDSENHSQGQREPRTSRYSSGLPLNAATPSYIP